MNPAGINAYRQAEQGTRSEEERDSEIVKHLPLVYSVVERVAVNLPPNVDRDDLYHAGVIGLMDAIDRFDPSRDNAFSTYAVLRIRGAVIDELRSRDWVPRSTRSRAKEYQTAVTTLHHKLGRLPDEQELAEHLDMSVEELLDLERTAQLSSQISLDTPVGDNASLGDLLPRGAGGDDPIEGLDREDRARLLRDVLGTLKEQELLIVKLYYFEGLLMKEIAKILEVTESRICQIHSRIITVLRGRLTRAGLET